MLSNLKMGTQFYYADRKKQKPVNCTLLGVQLGHPLRILARNNETGEIFDCYDGFGVYNLNEYDEALEDAQIQGDRRIL